MANTWTAFTFKKLLAEQVIANLGAIPAPAITVLSYFPTPDEPLTDSIILGYTITDANEPVVLGDNRYDETVTLECQIRVVRPGAGETKAQEAETRAALLLSHVETRLRTSPPTVGDQTFRARVATRTASLFAWQAGEVAARVALIEFQVIYRARTSDT